MDIDIFGVRQSVYTRLPNLGLLFATIFTFFLSLILENVGP